MFDEPQKSQPSSNAIPLQQWNSGIYPTVAVIDTGISVDLLENAMITPGINLSGEGCEDNTTDRNGHGTAVASTILQLAPQSPILPIKLMVDCGYLRLPNQLEVAFEWILAHRTRLGIGVICAPFADGSHRTDDQPHRGSRLRSLIAALRTAGVATVAPAGNGYRQNRIWGEQGMAWPAILREVISAGAITHIDGLPRLSPKTQRLNSILGTGCCTTAFVVPGEPGGTSGAAAVVAGCLATLQGIYPGITVDELVKQLMLFHCDVIDNDLLTWPVLDVYKVAEFTALWRLPANHLLGAD